MVTNQVTYEFNRESRLLTPGHFRIKRIVRESFRLNQHDLPAIDMVVMVKSGIDQLDNKEINQQLAKIWRKIIQRHKS